MQIHHVTPVQVSLATRALELFANRFEGGHRVSYRGALALIEGKDRESVDEAALSLIHDASVYVALKTGDEVAAERERLAAANLRYGRLPAGSYVRYELRPDGTQPDA